MRRCWVVVLTALAACGGGGGGGGAPAPSPPPTAPPIVGRDVSSRAGAIVFADSGGDGLQRAGAQATQSGPDGEYGLTQSGRVALSGGIDLLTGVPRTYTRLRAPRNGDVLSPLSTLIVVGGVDEAEVASAFGLSTSLDILRFDPIAMLADAPDDAQAVVRANQAVAVVAAALGAVIEAAGITERYSDAVDLAFAALAEEIDTTGALDLASSATLRALITRLDPASDVSPEASNAIADAIGGVIERLQSSADALSIDARALQLAGLTSLRADVGSVAARQSDAGLRNNLVAAYSSNANLLATSHAPFLPAAGNIGFVSGLDQLATLQDEPIEFLLSDLASNDFAPDDLFLQVSNLTLAPGADPSAVSISVDPQSGRATVAPQPGFTGSVPLHYSVQGTDRANGVGIVKLNVYESALPMMGAEDRGIDWNIIIGSTAQSNAVDPAVVQSVADSVVAAGELFERYLDSAGASIEIQLEFAHGGEQVAGVTMFAGSLARVGGLDTIFVKRFKDGRPIEEPIATREIRTGEDANGAGVDGVLIVNIDQFGSFFFEPDPFERSGPIPPGQMDMISLLLHELTHILGYVITISDGTDPGSQNRLTAFEAFQVAAPPPLTFEFVGPGASSAFGRPVPMQVDSYQHLGNFGNLGLPGENLRIAGASGSGLITDLKKTPQPVDIGVLEDVGYVLRKPTPLNDELFGFERVFANDPAFDGNDSIAALAGDDIVRGLSGDDALDGGSGDDLLDGGPGTDVLTGGPGADVLIVDGGDSAFGDEGDDEFVAVSEGFELIDGGAGIDGLEIAGGMPLMDLVSLAGNQITGIERIRLSSSGTTTLRVSASSVSALAGQGGSLVVAGDADDSVEFTDTGWMLTGQISIDGAAFNTYVNGSANLTIAVAVIQ